VRVPSPSDPFRREIPGGRAMSSGGSWGVRYWYEPLRKAASQARLMLIGAAAEQLGVPAAQLVAENGAVHHKATGRAVSFGALSAAAASRPIPEPNLRPDSELKLIGKGIPRIDTPAKTNGAATFSMDLRLPGMVYAYAVMSPVFKGDAESFDATEARKIKGVIDVVKVPGGAAVVADNSWTAMQAAEKLVVKWRKMPIDELDSATLSAMMREGLGATQAAVAKQEGDVDAALAAAARVVESDYEVPYIAHTPMEPWNCTVRITGDIVELWGPLQNQDRVLAAAARRLGIPADKIVIHSLMPGGGYGRRLGDDGIHAALVVAKAINRPVKLVWKREDEIGQGWYRPAQMARLRAAIDSDGKITGFWFRASGPSMQTEFAPAGVRNNLDGSSVQNMAEMRYRFGAVRIDYAMRHVPIPCAPWRAVGATQNAFFVESFIDEVAIAAGKDPLALRRELLAHDARALRVINEAAEKFGWDKPLPAGRAKGFGYFESFGALTAHAVEVSIENKRPRVHRVVCAIDCGKVVMPDGARQQMEGGVIMGLSAAMHEKVSIEKGRAVETNFDRYQLMRIDEAPHVEVVLLETPGVAMGGIGEPGLPPISAAVGNAIHALTERRIRKLPLMDSFA
jgi:isoquinoline 1-oxidoreductase beta subunit